MEDVLIARKVHIAFVAVPGRGFRVSRCCMARRPSGVAAFERPSMLAAMFITMEPMAGWLAGTSGKRRRSRGLRNRARISTRPAFSARRIMPSHSAQMPRSGRASFMTAVLQASKAAWVVSVNCPESAARVMELRTRPSQIQLSMRATFSHAKGHRRKAILRLCPCWNHPVSPDDSNLQLSLVGRGGNRAGRNDRGCAADRRCAGRRLFSLHADAADRKSCSGHQKSHFKSKD